MKKVSLMCQNLKNHHEIINKADNIIYKGFERRDQQAGCFPQEIFEPR